MASLPSGGILTVVKEGSPLPMQCPFVYGRVVRDSDCCCLITTVLVGDVVGGAPESPFCFFSSSKHTASMTR